MHFMLAFALALAACTARKNPDEGLEKKSVDIQSSESARRDSSSEKYKNWLEFFSPPLPVYCEDYSESIKEFGLGHETIEAAKASLENLTQDVKKNPKILLLAFAARNQALAEELLEKTPGFSCWTEALFFLSSNSEVNKPLYELLLTYAEKYAEGSRQKALKALRESDFPSFKKTFENNLNNDEFLIFATMFKKQRQFTELVTQGGVLSEEILENRFKAKLYADLLDAVHMEAVSGEVLLIGMSSNEFSSFDTKSSPAPSCIFDTKRHADENCPVSKANFKFEHYDTITSSTIVEHERFLKKIDYLAKKELESWKYYSSQLNSPVFPAAPEEKKYNVLNLLALIAPKKFSTQTVYRGTNCRESHYKRIIPHTTWSTSIDMNIAANFAKRKEAPCILEISLDPGAPILIIDSQEYTVLGNESEFVLPAWVLDKSVSKFIKPSYTIEKPKREYILDRRMNKSSGIKMIHRTLVKKLQTLKSRNGLPYDGKESFAEYQKKYRDKVCALVSHIDYLNEICLASKEFEYSEAPRQSGQEEVYSLSDECKNSKLPMESCLLQFNEEMCLKKGLVWGGVRCLLAHEIETQVESMKIEEDTDLLLLDLKVKNPGSFKFLPGQHVFIGNKDQARPYGIANSYTSFQKTGILKFIIKLSTKHSEVSFTHLFRTLKVNDTLHISGAKGSFILDPNLLDKPIVFVSADSGYAPLLSMMESLKDSNAQNKRYFVDYLNKKNAPKFVSSQARESGAEIISNFPSTGKDTLYYYCGGAISKVELLKQMKESNIPIKNLHSCQ